MRTVSIARRFLSICLLFFGIAGVARPQHQKLDSLKARISQSIDSLEVARLCMEVYTAAKYELLVEEEDEGRFLMRALRIYEHEEDFNSMGKVYNALGGIYYNRKQFREARKYWSLSKKCYHKSQNGEYELVLFSNLSLTYLRDTAANGPVYMKAYLDSALQMRHVLRDSCRLSSVYDNLGTWEMKYGSMEKAVINTERALQIAKDCENNKSVQALLFQLGKIQRRQGDYRQAIKLIDESLDYQVLRKTDPNYLDAMLELSELYYLLGEYKRAYDYQVLYQQHKDTLFQTEQAKTLMDLEMAYETNKKERIIQEKERQLQRMVASEQFRNRLVGVGIISLLLVFAGIYFYRSYRFILESREMELRYSHKLLVAHEEERRRISQELHDSVGQRLILIKNRVALNADEPTTQMVAQALEEMRSISKALHSAVFENLGLTTSIKKLICDADEHSEIFFSEEIDFIDGLFSKDSELQIYRIIQESLSNILKHSKTDSALIVVKDELELVRIRVQDYGIGFDWSGYPGSENGIGMKTMKERAQLLGGTLLIESAKAMGTTIMLTVPKKNRSGQ